MMRPIDLLKRSSALDIMVSIESVDDVERVSREKQSAQWSEAGVAAVLERLETRRAGSGRGYPSGSITWWKTKA